MVSFYKCNGAQEKFEIYSVGPKGPHGGHMHHLNKFEAPTPKDDSCQV